MDYQRSPRSPHSPHSLSRRPERETPTTPAYTATPGSSSWRDLQQQMKEYKHKLGRFRSKERTMQDEIAARQKMTELTNKQFASLAEAVYGEACLRNEQGEPLSSRVSERNTSSKDAKKTLYEMSKNKFNNLASDVYHEITRRDTESWPAWPTSPSIADVMTGGTRSSASEQRQQHNSRHASSTRGSQPDDYESKLNQLREENKRLRMELEEENIRSERLRDHSEKCQDTLDRKTKEYSALRAEHKQLKEEHDKLQHVVEDVKSEINELRNELDDMETLKVENKDLRARASIQLPSSQLGPIKVTRDGVIRADYIRSYNFAMDNVLNEASAMPDRLVAMNSVMKACNGIKKDMEGQEASASMDDLNQQLAQMIKALSDLADLYKDETLAIPRLLLPATATQLTTTVAKITKELGLRPEPGEKTLAH